MQLFIAYTIYTHWSLSMPC